MYSDKDFHLHQRMIGLPPTIHFPNLFYCNHVNTISLSPVFMTNYVNLVVENISHISNESVVVNLRTLNSPLMSFEAGQFLTIFFSEDNQEIKRAFSICSVPDELPFLTLAIKHKNDGPTYRSLISKLEPGKILKALPPLGNFTLNRIKGTGKYLYFFGAGSGIAPLFSMIKEALNKKPRHQLILIYANRDEKNILFKDELESMANNHRDRFRMYYILSSPIDRNHLYKGRVSQNILSHILSGYETELSGSDFFLCGPQGFMNVVEDFLLSKSISANQIHHEDFVVKILTETKNYNLSEQLVTVIVHGEKNSLIVPANKSIMSAAEENGIKLPCKCKEGNCHTCKAKLLSGVVLLKNHQKLSEAELKDENCLTCVGYPVSENVVIFYDEPGQES